MTLQNQQQLSGISRERGLMYHDRRMRATCLVQSVSQHIPLLPASLSASANVISQTDSWHQARLLPRQHPRQLKRGVYGCIPVQMGWSKLPQSAPEGGPGGGAPPAQVFDTVVAKSEHWKFSPSTHPLERAQQSSPANPQGPSTSGGCVHTPLDTTRSTISVGSKIAGSKFDGGMPACPHAGLSAQTDVISLWQ